MSDYSFCLAKPSDGVFPALNRQRVDVYQYNPTSGNTIESFFRSREIQITTERGEMNSKTVFLDTTTANESLKIPGTYYLYRDTLDKLGAQPFPAGPARFYGSPSVLIVPQAA